MGRYHHLAPAERGGKAASRSATLPAAITSTTARFRGSEIPMPSHDVEELKQNGICFVCIGEPYLKTQIEKARKVALCSYCNKNAASIEIGELSERVHSAFEAHYERTASEPDSYQYAMLGDKESDYEWEREGEPAVYAIMNAANIPEEAAEDIRIILEDENAT